MIKRRVDQNSRKPINPRSKTAFSNQLPKLHIFVGIRRSIKTAIKLIKYPYQAYRTIDTNRINQHLEINDSI